MRLLRALSGIFSPLYAFGVYIRNRLFDWGILRSEQGALLSVVIGNLSAGGTGKTPHTEYLLRHFSNRYKTALLSRGYGRRSKGYFEADQHSSALQIGDEPLQIARKFPHTVVAVCEDRLKGLNHLKTNHSSLQVAFLDDAYQHRRLRGDLNILLTDYNHPWWTDWMLPGGNLRDNPGEKRRADIIIVSKCPIHLNAADRENIRTVIAPRPDQLVFYTTIAYGSPIQVSGPVSRLADRDAVMAFAGIADSQLFEKQASEYHSAQRFRAFGDHHIFSQADILTLQSECDTFDGLSKAWLTTEKDAMRLKDLELPFHIPVFYLPIEIHFLADEELFLRRIEETLAGWDRKPANQG